MIQLNFTSITLILRHTMSYKVFSKHKIEPVTEGVKNNNKKKNRIKKRTQNQRNQRKIPEVSKFSYTGKRIKVQIEQIYSRIFIYLTMRKALTYGRKLAVEANSFLDNSQNCQIISNISTHKLVAVFFFPLQ